MSVKFESNGFARLGVVELVFESYTLRVTRGIERRDLIA